MKKKLETALAHAKEYLGYYQAIPEGMFGSIMITSDISEGEEILRNFDKTDKALIKRIIDKLEAIE